MRSTKLPNQSRKADATDETLLRSASTVLREGVLSQILTIQVENFRESLKLTQRSIYLGLLVAGTVYYLGNLSEGKELPSVPFLNVEFSSAESLQVVLLVLYIGSGMTAWFSTSRALQVLVRLMTRKLQWLPQNIPV